MNENSSSAAAPSASAATPADIDMSFLQQFSCMGTTDHDELVHQLLKVIGGPLSVDTAKFFLEMNNWNLQGAVGSYFDYHAGLRLPSMRLVVGQPQQATESLLPQTQFAQSWHVQNNGDEPWPLGCYLRCTGNAANMPQPATVPVTSVPAGAEAMLVAPMTSNSTAGVYRTQWQLCTSNGSVFGDILWATYVVQPGQPIDGDDDATVAMASDASTTSMMAVPVMGPMQEQEQQQQQQQQQQSSEDTEMC